MISVLLEVKQIDLGNGGAGVPGSFLKLKRLETLATKQNRPQAPSAHYPDMPVIRRTCCVGPSKCKNFRAYRQNQCFGLGVEGDRSDRERSTEEAVCSSFYQLVVLEIDLIVYERPIPKPDIECL